MLVASIWHDSKAGKSGTAGRDEGSSKVREKKGDWVPPVQKRFSVVKDDKGAVFVLISVNPYQEMKFTDCSKCNLPEVKATTD